MCQGVTVQGFLALLRSFSDMEIGWSPEHKEIVPQIRYRPFVLIEAGPLDQTARRYD